MSGNECGSNKAQGDTKMLKRLALMVSLGAMLASLTTATLSAHAVNANGAADPRFDRSSVAPYGTITYNPILFSSPDVGVVQVEGDGSTKLDVAVYDSRGNLIIHFSGYSPRVTFYPYW